MINFNVLYFFKFHSQIIYHKKIFYFIKFENDIYGLYQKKENKISFLIINFQQ